MRTPSTPAGIAHQPGSFPYVATGDDAGVAYLVEAERLAALGSRKKISQALALIETAEHAATIIIAEPGDSSLLWLAESEHIAGWIVRPIDPTAVVATVTAARRLLTVRRAGRELNEMAADMTRETDRLLSIGVALSAERNISKLHELIVRNARELTRADSGSLFLLETNEGADTAACASPWRKPDRPTPARIWEPCCRSRGTRSPATSP